MTISSLATQRILSPSHGGRFAAGQPSVIIVHCTESPMQAGGAAANAKYLAGHGLSVHYLVDPGGIVAGLDESTIGWGAGTINPRAIHVEFCGYARFSREEWLTADGERMLDFGRHLFADIAKRQGIPLRFLTDSELAAGARGLTTHAQCTRVIGGTTHTDPGTGFPLPLLLTGGIDMAALENVVRKVRNFRDRFLKGQTPTLDMRLEDIIVDIYEMTRYGVGILDNINGYPDSTLIGAGTLAALSKKIDALAADVARLKAGTAPAAFSGTVELKAR